MTDKKFTDEEIIKRLERCVKRGNRNYDTDIVLDLINRQKAEIEQLKRNYDALKYQENLSNRHCRNICEPKYKAEIERLKENLNIELEKYATEYDNTIKAEAYKEFAERLKENFFNLQYNAKTDRKNVKIEELKEQMDWLLHTVAIETVENLLKEMVGE